MKPFTREPGQSYIFYAPDHPNSVRYTDSGSEVAINTVTSWVRRNFPASIRGNFQGERGQLALHGPVSKELERLAGTLVAVPFIDGSAH